MAIERITPENAKEWRQLGLQHLQRYELAGRFAGGRNVLDLACGNGYGAYTLMNLGAQSVRAVDLDPDAVGYANAHYARSNLSFECGDCFKLEAVNPGYELIVSFETIEHLPDPRRFVRKLRDVISSHGRLVISAPNTLRYKRAPRPIVNPFHLSEPTYEEFREWVATEFSIDQEWEQSPVSTGLGRQTALVERSALIRSILFAESCLKRVFRRPSLRAALEYADSWETNPEFSTQVFPLLPERRRFADVFLFVCTPR